MSDHLQQALSSFNSSKAEWVGFREVRETTAYRYARDGKPQNNETSVSHGVMVEVLANGQFGYAASSRLDIESLVGAARRAEAQALQASRWPVFRFTQAQRPPVRLRYDSPLKAPAADRSAGQVNDLLVRICERIRRSPKIVRAGAFSQLVDSETRFVSSNGSDAHQRFRIVMTGVEATAQDGNIVQTRTDGGLRGRSYQGGWELVETPDFWDRVDRVRDQALELIAAPQCPDETMSLVLMPDQMMLQIHESIGHPLELDRILGDERNYAGWSFVRTEDFGKLRYGSELMNVSFDPTVSHELATYAFDDNGNPARKDFLIEKGILKRALGGLESQARSGVPGVANARASSWNRPPIDRMANINLEPGDSSLEQIIASVERGVLMESNRSWSIDDFRNKFQFGCEYARLIENGRITRTVRNPNYRGVTVPFWNSLSKVGDRSTLGVYGTPNCGKGEPNQMIRVGHASPACRFDGIEVFGGA